MWSLASELRFQCHVGGLRPTRPVRHASRLALLDHGTSSIALSTGHISSHPRLASSTLGENQKAAAKLQQANSANRFENGLVAFYCAIPRDYLSDTPLLRAMGFLVPQHGQFGAIPPPPFLSVSPLESMRSGGAILPTKGVSQRYLRDTLRKQGKMCPIPPSAILSRKGIARYGGISRTGPLSRDSPKSAKQAKTSEQVQKKIENRQKNAKMVGVPLLVSFLAIPQWPFSGCPYALPCWATPSP